MGGQSPHFFNVAAARPIPHDGRPQMCGWYYPAGSTMTHVATKAQGSTSPFLTASSPVPVPNTATRERVRRHWPGCCSRTFLAAEVAASPGSPQPTKKALSGAATPRTELSPQTEVHEWIVLDVPGSGRETPCDGKTTSVPGNRQALLYHEPLPAWPSARRRSRKGLCSR